MLRKLIGKTTLALLCICSVLLCLCDGAELCSAATSKQEEYFTVDLMRYDGKKEHYDYDLSFSKDIGYEDKTTKVGLYAYADSGEYIKIYLDARLSELKKGAVFYTDQEGYDDGFFTYSCGDDIYMACVYNNSHGITADSFMYVEITESGKDYIKGVVRAEAIKPDLKYTKYVIADCSFCIKLDGSTSRSGNSSSNKTTNSGSNNGTDNDSYSNGKSSNKSSCTKCGGSGRCQICPNNGYMPCSGFYCHNGRCGVCNGNGYIKELGGSTRVICSYCNAGKCTVCSGKGKIECSFCNGSGKCSQCRGV